MTESCAISIDSSTRCVYRPRVVLTLECRRRLCTVLTSEPLLTSQLANPWRKLWKPNRCPGLIFTPAASAAGRRWSKMRTLADLGLFPLHLALAKTQSLGRPYTVSLCPQGNG